MDNTNLKTNFLGRDGFRWWIGQVPPSPNHKVNYNVNENWGLKRRVRIMGYHPDENKLPDKDLPLAIVLLPPTAGTGAANQAQSIHIEPGEIVLGFFLDGDDAQVPAIIASFGRTRAATEAFAEYSGAFIPFTGYTNEIPNPTGTTVIAANESNEERTDAVVSPINVTQDQAEKRNPPTVTVSSVLGKQITKESPCVDGSVNKVKTTVNNFLEDFKRLSNMGEGQIDKINESIKETTKTIATGVNGLVGDISENVVGELTGQVQTGLKVLYDGVFSNILALTANPVAAHLGGVAAQKAMVLPVNTLSKALPCLSSNVNLMLEDIIEKMLKSMVDSFDDVTGFPECMADQFTGAALNSIVDSIGSTLATPLGGITKVLSSGYDITEKIRSKVDMISTVGAIFDCGQNIDKCTGLPKSFTIGGGIKDTLDSVDGVLDAANNLVQSVDGVGSSLDVNLNIPNFAEDFKDPLGACFGGTRTGCGKPKVRIFGGNGLGAAAEAIMGTLNGPPGFVETTASIIGIKLNKPGVDYEFPPFVEIVDECKQGYGAVARALVKNGEVVGIYMVSEGEGYPPGEIEEVGVVDTIVDNPGLGYSEGDIGVDNFGNEYKVIVDKGSIVSVKPLNISITPNLPQIRIKGTGTGALIRPVLGTPEYKGEVQQVIDCIDDGGSLGSSEVDN
tara:strand:- start:17478 stop:19502 length:2025 start_codon:yes stop_codon:yes gene_type:complete